MNRWNSPRGSLCAETLEDRRLLSASPALIPQPLSSGPLHVIEYGPEYSDEDEATIELRAGELAPHVRAAIDAKFPGAAILEAEMSLEDGEAELDIAAIFKGGPIDIAVTPAGQIIESERQLDTAQLPAEVLEWVRRNFPHAKIEEATLKSTNDGVTYEVLIAPETGAAIEATLRVDAPPALLPVPADPFENDVVATGEADEDDLQIESPALLTSIPFATETPIEQLVDFATDPADVDAAAPRAAAVAQVVGTMASKLFATAPQIVPALASTLPPEAVAQLPELAALLVQSADIAVIEQALSRLLAQIDSLAEDVVAESTTGGVATRLAMIAVLLSATRLLVLRGSRQARGPVLSFNAGNSTWSWLLSPNRRRLK